MCSGDSSCGRQSLVRVSHLLNQFLGEMPGFRLYVPIVGEWLRFRYPPACRLPTSPSATHQHCFYDDFPNGRKVRATESSVSLHADIQRLEVRSHWIPFYEIRDGVARKRRGYFIAVRFVNDDGLMLRTNFSRDDHAWLLPSEDSD